MGKNRNIVVQDYRFAGYETWEFKDRLIRANEYLNSINEPSIVGLKYESVGKKIWRKDKRALFRSLDPQSDEIRAALIAYATSSTQTLSEFRSRIIPVFAFVLSILSLLLNLEFWSNLRGDFAIPVITSVAFIVLGYVLYISEKQITIPDSKGKGTMAIVTAILELRAEKAATLTAQTKAKTSRRLAVSRNLLKYLRREQRH